METNVGLAPAAEAERTFSLMERVRNSNLGRKAVALAASLTMLGGAGEQALNPEPVSAETNTPAQSSTPPENYTEEDVNLALAQPAQAGPIHMIQAGIRPYTGWRYSQAVVGSLRYPEINPNLIRTASGRLQDFRKGEWRFFYGGDPGGWQDSDGGLSTVFSRPGHADPGYRYLFNDCVPGKGFRHVRLIIDLVIRDAISKGILGDEEYIYPVPIQGNCAKARRSSQIAERQMEKNYGI